MVYSSSVCGLHAPPISFSFVWSSGKYLAMNSSLSNILYSLPTGRSGTRPERPWGPPSFLYNGYRVFPAGKATGAWRWPPTLSSPDVEERIELYLYSTSGTSWPVIGWTLTLPDTDNHFGPNWYFGVTDVCFEVQNVFVVMLSWIAGRCSVTGYPVHPDIRHTNGFLSDGRKASHSKSNPYFSKARCSEMGFRSWRPN